MARRMWLGTVAVALVACGDLEQALVPDPSADEGTSDGSGAGLDAPLEGGADATDTMPAADGSVADSGTDDASVGDSSGGPPLACGDGQVDPDETCDDGNRDETDDCTTLCAPPSCRDGILSGAETGPDCGGPSCDACPVNADCTRPVDCQAGLVCSDASQCVLPPSCLALQQAWPQTESGDATLDPDGDGSGTVFACDMGLDGGGWTRVLRESFDTSDGAQWSPAHPITSCGTLGPMLGGAGQFSAMTVSRPVDLLGVPHVDARMQARVFKIDSWDNETVTAAIDGTAVWQGTYPWTDGPNDQCGMGWNEAEHLASGRLQHAAKALTLSFSGNFDQGADNEAWGINDVEVWVR